MLGGAFLLCSDSTMDLSLIARSVPRRLGGGVCVFAIGLIHHLGRYLYHLGAFPFLLRGKHNLLALLFGVPATLILLPLALTDFVVTGRIVVEAAPFVVVCFAACDGPFLGLRFWGSHHCHHMQGCAWIL